MAATLKSLVPVYEKLKKEWDRKPPNLEECGKLLDQLKLKLIQTQINFLPTQNSDVDHKEIILARDILEIGAQWSIAKKDVESFERYMAQLKCYYLDYKPAGLKESAYKQQLLGLNLLRLLAQNKLADFHTELELLPPEDMQHNMYIKHPVEIEQYLMEGRYNKVFIARHSVPAPSYSFFMEFLLKTIRDEIASCIEKAYERLSFTEARRMLSLESDQAMTAYAQERSWTLNAAEKSFVFQRERKVDDVIPATQLAQQAIEYARELEMIV